MTGVITQGGMLGDRGRSLLSLSRYLCGLGRGKIGGRSQTGRLPGWSSGITRTPTAIRCPAFLVVWVGGIEIKSKTVHLNQQILLNVRRCG